MPLARHCRRGERFSAKKRVPPLPRAIPIFLPAKQKESEEKGKLAVAGCIGCGVAVPAVAVTTEEEDQPDQQQLLKAEGPRPDGGRPFEERVKRRERRTVRAIRTGAVIRGRRIRTIPRRGKQRRKRTRQEGTFGRIERGLLRNRTLNVALPSGRSVSRRGRRTERPPAVMLRQVRRRIGVAVRSADIHRGTSLLFSGSCG